MADEEVEDELLVIERAEADVIKICAGCLDGVFIASLRTVLSEVLEGWILRSHGTLLAFLNLVQVLLRNAPGFLKVK